LAEADAEFVVDRARPPYPQIIGEGNAWSLGKLKAICMRR